MSVYRQGASVRMRWGLRRQQHVNRARPAINLSRRYICDDRTGASQQSTHCALQHRSAVTGSQAFPMDHPDAAKIASDRLNQKCTQCLLGISDVQTVQVDLRLHPILSAAEFLEDRALKASAVKGEFFATREGRIVYVAGQAFPQDRVTIGASETSARLGLP